VRQQTSYVPQTTTQKAWRTVQKTVMHNKTVASTKQIERECGCYQQQCGCQGQWNCGCCYPKCGCAPITQTEYSNIQVPVQISVNEQYDVPVTRQVAVTKDVTYDIMVPENYTETENYQVAENVDYQKEIMVPEVQQSEVTIHVPVQKMVSVTEQKAHRTSVMVPTQVLTEVWEAIPDPPCHWHHESHTHQHDDATSGTKHKHALPQP